MQVSLIILGVEDLPWARVLCCARMCGGYSGVFADLDGHRGEVTHDLFWPLDADGRSILPE